MNAKKCHYNKSQRLVWPDKKETLNWIGRMGVTAFCLSQVYHNYFRLFTATSKRDFFHP